jgi:hypothetical protein
VSENKPADAVVAARASAYSTLLMYDVFILSLASYIELLIGQIGYLSLSFEPLDEIRLSSGWLSQHGFIPCIRYETYHGVQGRKSVNPCPDRSNALITDGAR